MFGANTIIYNSNNDTFLVSTLNHNSGYEKLTIVKAIIDSHPNAVSFPFLLSVYAPALSYESKVKKLRFTLNNIILQTQTLSNKKVIHVIKNKDDKRIKEVYIKY